MKTANVACLEAFANGALILSSTIETRPGEYDWENISLSFAYFPFLSGFMAVIVEDMIIRSPRRKRRVIGLTCLLAAAMVGVFSLVSLARYGGTRPDWAIVPIGLTISFLHLFIKQRAPRLGERGKRGSDYRRFQ